MAKGHLLPIDDIRKLINQGYDLEYHDSLYRQMRYAFGSPWSSESTGHRLVDGLADYPDIISYPVEVGRSRRIVNSQFIGLARTLSATPMPKFLDIDGMTAEGRQQFWRNRYEDKLTGTGGWDHEFQAAFMESDGLGIGYLFWGMETNPSTGFQRVCCKHVPTIRVISDRHYRNPTRARWIAYQDYWPVAEAAKAFGKKLIANNTSLLIEPTGANNTEPIEVVRIIHYFDRGIGDKEPTWATFVGGLSGEVVSHVDSEIGPILPVSSCSHYFAPGMSRPTGRILLQLATQEMMNKMETILMERMETGGPRDIVDVQQIEKEDVMALKNGEYRPMLRKIAPSYDNSHAVTRLPSQPLDENLTMLWQLMERQFNMDSGVSDFERNQSSQRQVTATETLQMAEKGSNEASWSERQVAQFVMHSVDVFTEFVRRYDRDPTVIDFRGANITINVPTDLKSWADNWFAEPSRVLVDKNSFTVADMHADRQQRLLELANIEQMAIMVNPMKLFEEKLRAIGEEPSEWIPMLAQAMAQSGTQDAMALSQMISPMMSGGGGAGPMEDQGAEDQGAVASAGGGSY